MDKEIDSKEELKLDDGNEDENDDEWNARKGMTYEEAMNRHKRVSIAERWASEKDSVRFLDEK
jgi:hypothetical protein